ncbi:site-specific DNA-methyltransferase [Apilactobacillus micheneri]|uniref:site-specific DNA-methyltransferase n=1 Tax=Apilactobacillus micheneri TaxID=1899430 RepID=UPI00112CA16E|nr:site-specific DNA-methyltransferase [Apilactobacillus micheneri]TPR39130.1 site-specific DNA-methyltransferase [Apilactobacillus micheneri]
MDVDSKIITHVKEVLNKFKDRYVNDNGALKRSKLIEDLDNFDKNLMTELFNDDLIHKNYVERIDNIEVFKLNKFLEILQYKEFWEDSYTKYSNKIGLTVGNKFIDDSSDVVLDFPFKDTVFKGNMKDEKEDDSDEPFLNETIAKEEIDELFEPKIFKNVKRFNTSGEKRENHFIDGDNLIVKGNNLISLYSIKERYAGKIKLIYLDPPYYFDETKPSDAFTYNSNFKLSTWLTFMKNRLEISKSLLSDNGVIIVSIGEDGQSYLKMLMDNVFGRKNFVETFLWKNTDNADSISNKSRSGIEYLHAFEMNKDYSKKWIGKESANGDAPLLNNGNGITRKLFPKGSIKFKIPDGKYEKGQYDSVKLLNSFNIKNRVNDRDIELEGHFKWSQQTIMKEIKNETYFLVKSEKFSIRFQRRNATFMAPEKWIDNRYLSKIFKIGTNEDATSHLKKLNLNFSNPKPETLLSFLIRAVTDENEYILDFFMGSATTQATAMKMNRKFIGMEQMDYINTISVPRLQKVIEGEQGEISKDVNWQGGGSFIYAELMEKNQGYLNDVINSKTLKELDSVYERMKNIVDFDFRVDLDKYEDTKNELSLESRKDKLEKMLDKNQLYYNYNNIDDKNVRDLLSDSDYEFNKSFYNKGE